MTGKITTCMTMSVTVSVRIPCGGCYGCRHFHCFDTTELNTVAVSVIVSLAIHLPFTVLLTLKSNATKD